MREGAGYPEIVYGQIDAASLHPELNISEAKYYSVCADKIKEIKYFIKQGLAIEHDLFVLSNTTHGVITLFVGLCGEGFRLAPKSGAYAPYRILSEVAAGPCCRETIGLETHIDPDTGRISPLSRRAGKPLVCDAAQSFATAARHDAALTADVFVCPLHKHAGLAAGLGLLGIKQKVRLPRLREVAALAEAGAGNYGILSDVAHRVKALSGHLINRFTLTLTQEHARKLGAVGIAVVSPLNEPLPFAILDGADPARMAELVHGSVFTFKCLGKCGRIRVSGAIRGSYGEAPLEQSSGLIALICRDTFKGEKIE